MASPILQNQNQNSVIRAFTQAYYELIGISPDTSPNDVTRMYNEYLACPTAGSAESFIRESEVFARKHAQLVQKVHGLVSSSGRPLSPDALNALVRRFVVDNAYNVDKLREDICRIEKDDCQRDGDSSSSSTLHQCEVIEGRDGCDAGRESGDVGPLPPCVGVGAGAEALRLDLGYLAAFEAEFDRPMFVQEYFFYKQRYPSDEDMAPVLADLHGKFNETYVAARQAYLNFLDKGLGMHQFVRVHLSDFETDDFMAKLVSSMIASEEYAGCMRAKLHSIHKSMYDEDLHDEDFEYLMKRVRSKAMALTNEGLSMEVSDFRAESVALGDRVEACFRKVLRRAAESDERSQNIRLFRRMIDSDNGTGDDQISLCESSLRKRLISCLEFHDVLKDMIRDALLRFEGGPREASTGQRYAALTEVLARITPSDDFEDVATHVAETVTAIFSKR